MMSFTQICLLSTVVLQRCAVNGLQILTEASFPDLKQFNSASFKSQKGQDKWLYSNIFGPLGLADSSPNYFIEFGARDGIMLSNTYFYEKELGWRGVLIEAGLD